jgi:amino acid permease
VQPSVTIPKAAFRVSAALCVLVPVLVICVASQYPGITLDPSTYWDSAKNVVQNISMESGFAAAFHLSLRQARMFSLVPCLICAYSFMWASCLQMKALADAQLLFPCLLKQREGESESPTRALIATVVFGLICLFLIAIARVVLGVSQGNNIKTLGSIQIIATLLVYLFVLVAYVYFRTWGRGSAAETYKNPFGRAGAVCAALIFLFMLAAIPFRLSVPAGSHREGEVSSGVAFAFVALYLAGLCVYYFRVAKEAQTTTDAESGAFLSIYAVRGMTDNIYRLKPENYRANTHNYLAESLAEDSLSFHRTRSASSTKAYSLENTVFNAVDVVKPSSRPGTASSNKVAIDA